MQKKKVLQLDEKDFDYFSRQLNLAGILEHSATPFNYLNHLKMLSRETGYFDMRFTPMPEHNFDPKTGQFEKKK